MTVYQNKRYLVTNLIFFYILYMSAFVGCSDPAIYIELTAWPNGADRLQMNITINNQKGMEEVIERNQTQFIIRLPSSASGSVHIDIIGFDNENCRIATGSLDDSVPTGLPYYVQRSLSLTSLTPAICTLTVAADFGPLNSTVSSVPPGILCQGNSGGTCMADFPKGTPIVLSASSNPNAYNSWSAPCEFGATCSLVLNSAMNINFSAFSRTSDGWYLWSPSPQALTLSAVWGSGPQDVWTVGAGGSILHWDGSKLVSVPSGTTMDLYGTWGTSASNAWAVGKSGTAVHWTGSQWSTVSTGTTDPWYGIWGTNDRDIWAVGGPSKLAWHWTGSAWSPTSYTYGRILYAIWGTGPIGGYVDAWAVGAMGGIAGLQDGTWGNSANTTQNPQFNGVSGTDANNTWAVGTGGAIVKLDGRNNFVPSGTTKDLYGVWGSNTNQFWVTGQMGTILQWDGNQWKSVKSGTTNDLYGIWGNNGGGIWAVGQAGTILYHK